MRENIGLFRGKRIDNGEWVEGSFLQCGEAHRPLDRPDIQFSDCYIVPKTDLDIVRLIGANAVGLDVWAYHVYPADRHSLSIHRSFPGADPGADARGVGRGGKASTAAAEAEGIPGTV